MSTRKQGKDFLLITMGSAGDVYPFIGLAQGLQKRGYKARIATHIRYQQVVEKAGVTCIPFGEKDDFDSLATNPLIWHPFKAFDFLVQEAILPTIEPVWEILQGFDPEKTILVSTILCFAARMAQEKHGFTLATAILQPSIIASAIKPATLHPTLKLHEWIPLSVRKLIINSMHALLLDQKFQPALDDIRNEHGLEPVRGIIREWIFSPDLVLGLFPGWFAEKQEDWPQSATTSNFVFWDQGMENDQMQEAREFIEGDDPVVLFTPGSEMLQGANFFREASGAVQQSGIKGIFVTKKDDQLPPDLPESIRAFSYLSFSKIFPLVDAVVFHGGIGTCAKALRAGIPQLVMPMSFDQPDNAARLKKLGTGDYLTPRQFRAARIARKLQFLLENAKVKENCNKIKDLMKEFHTVDTSLNALLRLADSKQ